MLLKKNSLPVLTADEAVAFIEDGDTVAFSGFIPAGSAKVVPRALAKRALEEHTRGHRYKLRVLTGASTGYEIDEILARAEAVEWRGPYQAGQAIRRQINRQEVEYVDMHLSHVPQAIAFGFFGRINFAVVEATEITTDGRVYLTPSIAKDGKISKIVPMCPHIDNNEHSVQVVVTEQGLADLRGLGPMQRARLIIDKCAHPLYKEYLQRYIKESRTGHIRHDLTRCFELHRNLMEHGSMLPD